MAVLFETGKVYNGNVYYNGRHVKSGLYLCTKITQRSKNGYAGNRYGSFRRVFSREIEDYNERTYVCKLGVNYGLIGSEHQSVEECYTKSNEFGPKDMLILANDVYTGNWYPKSNKKTKQKDIPIMKRELEL